MVGYFVAAAALVFAVGVYVGLGAPGWPRKPPEEQLKKNPYRPVARGLDWKGRPRSSQDPRDGSGGTRFR